MVEQAERGSSDGVVETLVGCSAGLFGWCGLDDARLRWLLDHRLATGSAAEVDEMVEGAGVGERALGGGLLG
ncbi:MAG: hypothetical protein WB767_18425, partial [Nocardioides sp.]